MILLFLGSFNSTLAIFLSIPLSILAAAFGLFLERLDDQRHDARRLRARDRPPGRRLGRRAREHQPPPGAREEPAAGRARRRGRGRARGARLDHHDGHRLLPGDVPLRRRQVPVQRAVAGRRALDARVVRRRDDGDPDLLRALPHGGGGARRGGRHAATAASPGSSGATSASPCATSGCSSARSTTSSW